MALSSEAVEIDSLGGTVRGPRVGTGPPNARAKSRSGCRLWKALLSKVQCPPVATHHSRRQV